MNGLAYKGWQISGCVHVVAVILSCDKPRIHGCSWSCCVFTTQVRVWVEYDDVKNGGGDSSAVAGRYA